ncbi:MAG: hypothetical protein DRR16_03415 [Candidatus Parabeggiatoa sp. nov. 3]|nr:MAG: hypothetical protein DRR00_04630 [Gammaproteobacteria bacterium]RKZ89061.1 MAG: hypothetical protein DRR16_03415 [Gammaproteobacteria bacterium]
MGMGPAQKHATHPTRMGMGPAQKHATHPTLNIKLRESKRNGGQAFGSFFGLVFEIVVTPIYVNR